MNSQLLKKASVELDENQLWNILIVMNKHYRDHVNRSSRSDLKKIVEVLSDAVGELQ